MHYQSKFVSARMEVLDERANRMCMRKRRSRVFFNPAILGVLFAGWLIGPCPRRQTNVFFANIEHIELQHI